MGYRHDISHLRADQQAIIRNKDENDKLMQNSHVSPNRIIANKPKKDDKHKIISNLLTEHSIKSSKGTLEIMLKLWDKEDNFQKDKITEILSKVKVFQEDCKKVSEEIFKNTHQDMELFGLIEDIDYSIGYASNGFGSKKEYFIYVTFRVKGNKNIIEHFQTKGWILDHKYKNDTGSPSAYKLDYSKKNIEYKYVMITLKKVIDESAYDVMK